MFSPQKWILATGLFSGNITFETVCSYSNISFFSTWFPMSWLFSHATNVKRRKNLLFILYAWRKQISVLICFFLFQKLIFLSFNWSSMRNSVWHCTDTNHFKQGQTIRMTVNEWHPHSVLNLRGKKNSKLNPQLPFGHVLFRCSFFCEALICLSGLLLKQRQQIWQYDTIHSIRRLWWFSEMKAKKSWQSFVGCVA